MKLSTLVLTAVATVGMSAYAAGGTTFKPRVKAGTATAAEGARIVSPKTNGMDMTKADAEIANSAATQQCSLPNLAKELSGRTGGKVSASSFLTSMKAGVLKTGNCSNEGIKGIKSNKAVENIGQETECLTRKGMTASNSNLDNERGACLLEAKSDDGAAQGTLQDAVRDAKEIAEGCGWTI